MENKLRLQRLTRRADFVRLKENGQSFHVNQWLLVNYEATDRGYLRGGWTIPTYVGGAVIRNRLRRWGREFLRNHPVVLLSIDINFIYKRREKILFETLSHLEFDSAMSKAMAKLGVRLG